MISSVPLQIGSFILLFIVVSVLVLVFINKAKNRKYKKITSMLEHEKNTIMGISIAKELSRVEVILKTEQLEERYKIWNERYNGIQDNLIPKITDLLLELDLLLEQKDYNNLAYKVVYAEMEVYRVKAKALGLLNEIKEITESGEKNRNIITKLKTEYRSLKYKFIDNKDYYGNYANVIEMQFELIEKRFAEFEKYMEVNDYDEVSHIIRALNVMLDHMKGVVEDVPQIVLLSTIIIPKKIEEVNVQYQKLVREGYNLDFLKFDYNKDASLKKIDDIKARTNVLNLENSILELKTILDYFDGLFNDFDKEKSSRGNFNDLHNGVRKRLLKVNDIMKNIINKIPEIKYNYDLSKEEVEKLNLLNGELVILNETFNKLEEDIKGKVKAYSILGAELNKILDNLTSIEAGISSCFKNIDNLKEDEVRAKDELREIELLLSETKKHLRKYKLPIVANKYYVQLKEAEEAILEVNKELLKKPISIKVLNVRVDTARDLVLKTYNLTNEMVKTAALAEKSIIYGNRYKSSKKEVEQGLNNAEVLFLKGEYKRALETSINSIDLIESGIYERLLEVYNKELI